MIGVDPNDLGLMLVVQRRGEIRTEIEKPRLQFAQDLHVS